MILDYLGGSTVIPRVLLRVKLEGQKAKSEEEVRVVEDHEQELEAAPRSWKKARKPVVPWSFRKEHSPSEACYTSNSRILK